MRLGLALPAPFTLCVWPHGPFPGSAVELNKGTRPNPNKTAGIYRGRWRRSKASGICWQALSQSGKHGRGGFYIACLEIRVTYLCLLFEKPPFAPKRPLAKAFAAYPGEKPRPGPAEGHGRDAHASPLSSPTHPHAIPPQKTSPGISGRGNRRRLLLRRVTAGQRGGGGEDGALRRGGNLMTSQCHMQMRHNVTAAQPMGAETNLES